jgi:hypothetical protein
VDRHKRWQGEFGKEISGSNNSAGRVTQKSTLRIGPQP